MNRFTSVVELTDKNNIGTLQDEYKGIFTVQSKNQPVKYSFLMQFSNFGNKFRGGTGIAELMHDLAHLPDNGRPLYRLGGGNPAYIPALNEAFAQQIRHFADNPVSFGESAGTYSAAQGHQGFIRSLSKLLNKQYGWPISERNIALTNGSQNAFFMLFNLFGGATAGVDRKILLPMSPEYIGYEDVSVDAPLFVSQRPLIEKLDDQLFKYRLDKANLSVDDDVAAICVSRPTNPTGNVLTDNEVAALDALALEHDVPLIIDNAYGAPFPNIINVPATLNWHENIVLSMSFSKLGLPGARTGIVVASEEIIDALTQMNAVMNLSPSSLAAGIMQPLFDNGEVLDLCEQHVRPHYQQRAQQALGWFRQSFEDVPALAHKPEGSIFLWLWFPELKITSAELYQRLKQLGVIIVPGHYFFPGLDEPWEHKNQCIRVNIGGDAQELKIGLDLIAREVQKNT